MRAALGEMRGVEPASHGLDRGLGVRKAPAIAGLPAVADDGSHVQRFTNNGAFQNEWGDPGTRDGQFNQAIGVAVDTYGDVSCLTSTTESRCSHVRKGEGSARGSMRYFSRRQKPTSIWFALWPPGKLLTIVRSQTVSETTYPQGFIATGLPVSSDHACPPGAGAGSVVASPVTLGWFD